MCLGTVGQITTVGPGRSVRVRASLAGRALIS